MYQNFSRQNLRGRSFRGQNLSGTDFSGADIRGADFTNAFLRGASFRGTKAGQQPQWAFLLIIVSWFLSVLSGLTAALAIGYVVSNLILVNSTAVTLVWIGTGTVSLFASLTIALAVAVATEIAGTRAGILVVLTTFAVSAIITTIGFSIVLVSSYIAWRSLTGDEKFAWIRQLAIVIATLGGTSFYGADLTDADFSQATLKSTDFRKANLIRTDWMNVKKLDHVRPGNTYLNNRQLRQVLITRNGQDRNFDRDDLRGVNFQGANLVDTSFIGTDLSKANLKDADLSRAKLVQTQLNGTDFTGATLTGAYIQDWGITSDTKFDGVRCEYVYMRFPTKENPDPLRKPDNNEEVFADGEFGDFIKPLFDTLDLYHSQAVDPRAIAISFKQLADNHLDAELEIVSMEKRGEDKFLLRAKTADFANKSELSAEYFTTFNELKGLQEREIKILLDEKDSRIRSLETMVMTALERPSFYSATSLIETSTISNNPGRFSIGGIAGENLTTQFHDLDFESAVKFLKLAGAKIALNNNKQRNLEIKTITGSLNSYAPLPALITINTPNDHDVNRLMKLSEGLTTNQSMRVGLLLYRKPPDPRALMEMANVRLRDSFVLIPIPMTLIEQALPDEYKCRGILEDYVARYLETVDFFDDKNAISDTFSFFGRKELLQILGEDLLRYQGIGLFGLRKSGKTSVLLQLGFLLREHPVIHIDLQRYGGSRYGAALFNDILDQLYTLEGEVEILQLEKFAEDKPATELGMEFIRRVSAVVRILKERKYKLPILCFLDEVERIIPNPEDHRDKAEEFNACFGALRVLSQEQHQLALLVTDVHPDCNRRNIWEQPGVATNPVFSFFKEVFMPPFSEEATQEMLTNIGSLMGLEFDQETPKQIHEQSGGHPFVSRQLASFIIKEIKEDANIPLPVNFVIKWSNVQHYLGESLNRKGELRNYLAKSIWEDLEKRNFKAAIAILQVLACNENLSEGITEQELIDKLKAKFTKNQCLDGCTWLREIGLLHHKKVDDIYIYYTRMPLLLQWIGMQML